MKKILKLVMIMSLLATTIFAIDYKIMNSEVHNKLKELENATIQQKKVMLDAYAYGATHGDLGYTLAAIAWQESSLGVNLFNLRDGHKSRFHGSYGVFHQLLSVAMAEQGFTSYASANLLAQALVTDQPFAQHQAVIELLTWSRYYGQKNTPARWSHMVAAYNAGYGSLESKKGYRYARSVLIKVDAISAYFKRHHLYQKRK